MKKTGKRARARARRRVKWPPPAFFTPAIRVARATYSVGTHARVETVLRQWVALCHLRKTDPWQATAARAREWRDLALRAHSPGTVEVDLSYMAGVYRRLGVPETDNPFTAEACPRPHPRRTRVPAPAPASPPPPARPKPAPTASTASASPSPPPAAPAPPRPATPPPPAAPAPHQPAAPAAVGVSEHARTLAMLTVERAQTAVLRVALQRAEAKAREQAGEQAGEHVKALRVANGRAGAAEKEARDVRVQLHLVRLELELERTRTAYWYDSLYRILGVERPGAAIPVAPAKGA